MCMYMQLDSLVNSVLYSLTLWKVVEFMLVPFGKLLHLCWCLAVDVLLVWLIIMAVYGVVENSEMNNLREVNVDFAKVFSYLVVRIKVIIIIFSLVSLRVCAWKHKINWVIYQEFLCISSF